MKKRGGGSNLLSFLLLGAILISVWLAMFQVDRQWARRAHAGRAVRAVRCRAPCAARRCSASADGVDGAGVLPSAFPSTSLEVRGAVAEHRTDTPRRVGFPARSGGRHRVIKNNPCCASSS